MPMELRWIDTRDALYAAELTLRFELLRRPLGMPPGSEIFPFEAESLHLVAVEASEVIGCVLFHREGEGGRLFQMAVAEAWQHRGIGSRLVRALEERLRRDGVAEIHLHAREPFVRFYERLGYAIVGEPFTEVGILHRKMQKTVMRD
jgi:ribosomal protein S18 acetylase RimI-like enzyme